MSITITFVQCWGCLCIWYLPGIPNSSSLLFGHSFIAVQQDIIKRAAAPSSNIFTILFKLKHIWMFSNNMIYTIISQNVQSSRVSGWNLLKSQNFNFRKCIFEGAKIWNESQWHLRDGVKCELRRWVGGYFILSEAQKVVRNQILEQESAKHQIIQDGTCLYLVLFHICQFDLLHNQESSHFGYKFVRESKPLNKKMYSTNNPKMAQVFTRY